MTGNVIPAHSMKELAQAIKLAVTPPPNAQILGCGDNYCYCDGSCVGQNKIGFEEWVNEGINPQQENGLGGLLMKQDKSVYTERELEIIEACEYLKEVLLAKNKNYGDSFSKYYQKRGAVSLEMRLEDKMNRLANLIGGDKDLVGESLADTILDISGYSILGFIEENRDGSSSY